MTNDILSAYNLTIGYSSKKGGITEVSKDLCLTLKPGELVSLIGPNGSGKSTLIRTITGLQPSLKGDVYINGYNISKLSSEEKATILSVVLTTPIQVGNMTAFDIVALGRYPYTNWAGSLSKDDESVVIEALNLAGAGYLCDRYIHTLSDGERQKVMIARAIAQNPSFMVLDEPTAFLDLPNRIEIMRVLRNISHCSKRTILLSTHDLSLALRCSDRLWIIKKDGRFCSGSPEDLILNGKLEEAFSLTDVYFDKINGDFKIVVTRIGIVNIVGNKTDVYYCTVNALDRIGISVTDEKCLISVKIVSYDKKNEWIIDVNGEKMIFEDLETLTNALLSILGEEHP